MKHIKRFTALFFEYLYRFIQFLLSPFVTYIALICIQAIIFYTLRQYSQTLMVWFVSYLSHFPHL